MSGISDFFKKAWNENQEGYKNIERQKERERHRREIEEDAKEQEKRRAKFRRQFELEVQQEYAEHRRALQDYKEKLDSKGLQLSIREARLSQGEEDLERRIQEIVPKEAELIKRELEISEKEDESIKRAKANIKKYSDKKKRELYVEAEKAKETARADLNALKEYKEALHRAEFTIIDWMKRVDRKEREAFEEVRKDVDEYQKCNQSPPEDGVDFERKFAAALKLQGFENVVVTEESGDFGADILAEKGGVKYVIQCKYYTSSVGVKAVQQVFASKIHYSAHVAVVATNSVFTKSAKVLAEETGVLLWNGLKVQEMLSAAAP